MAMRPRSSRRVRTGTAYKVVERGIIMGKGTRTEMDLSKAVGYVNLKQAGEDTSAATCYYVLSKTENFDNCWTLDENGKLQYSLLVNRVFKNTFDTDITFRPYVKVPGRRCRLHPVCRGPYGYLPSAGWIGTGAESYAQLWLDELSGKG